MTTIRELEKAVAAISQGANAVTLRSVPLANPTITNDLGPVTSKMEKLKTIYTAIAINYLLGMSKAPHGYDHVNFAGMREAIRNLSEQLIFSEKLVTSSYAQSIKDLTDRCNHAKITSQVVAVTKALTPEPTTPVWATMLDVTLATGLSFVPFVGPVLSSAATGGLGKLVTGLAGMGVTEVNLQLGVATSSSYNKDFKATTSAKDGLLQMPGSGITAIAGTIGTSKTTVGSALVSYLAERDKKKAKKTLEDPTAFVNSFGKVINPITQNQLLNNKIFENIRLNVSNPTIVTAVGKVESCLEKESDTVESYIDKFGEAVELSGSLIVAVVTSCVVDSFGDILEAYKTEFDSIKSNPKFSGMQPWVKSSEDQGDKARILALVITAYYLNPGIKASVHSKTGAGVAFMGMFGAAGLDVLIESNIRDGLFIGRSQHTSGPLGNLSAQKENIKETFRDEGNPTVAFATAAKKGENYIVTVKDSMIGTINKVLFANNNMGHFKEIITIFAASNMIVNAVWKAAATQQKLDVWFSEKFKVPKKAVDALKSAGFVKTYTTTIGRVSNDEKLRHMGGATINQQTRTLEYSDTNRKTATLRYYDGTFKGASDREKVMLYLFARAVTSDVNLFHVFIGIVSWETVKEQLHAVIAEINISSHFVDQADLRPASR